MAAAALSIQESLFPDLTCFGCGPANTEGFHLRSYQHGDLTVAMFTPRPEHDNGFGFLDGGIMATVLDCHSAAVVMWEVHHRGWKAEGGAPIPFVTAGIDVRSYDRHPSGPSWNCERDRRPSPNPRSLSMQKSCSTASQGPRELLRGSDSVRASTRNASSPEMPLEAPACLAEPFSFAKSESGLGATR